MDDNDNISFVDLLDLVSKEQTFELVLTNNISVACKQLSTQQLKRFIETIVDSPLTQAAFNSTATKIFKECVCDITETQFDALTIIDKLIFILETRIRSISPNLSVNKDDPSSIIELTKVLENIKNATIEHITLFCDKTITQDKFTLSFGPPLLLAEAQLNSEIYSTLKPNLNNEDELRTVLGDIFVNEIAKSLKSVKIDGSVLDFSTTTFRERLKILEKLPASLIQEVVEYVEAFKKVTDSCLIVDGYSLSINGSLFSIR